MRNESNHVKRHVQVMNASKRFHVRVQDVFVLFKMANVFLKMPVLSTFVLRKINVNQSPSMGTLVIVTHKMSLINTVLQKRRKFARVIGGEDLFVVLVSARLLKDSTNLALLTLEFVVAKPIISLKVANVILAIAIGE